MREENQLRHIALHKRLEKTNKQIAQLTQRRDAITPAKAGRRTGSATSTT